MWVDDTRTVEEREYALLTERVFAHFDSLPGVVAYGSFGSVGAPGLSDLDLIVVVEDEALTTGAFRLPALSEHDRYFLTHDPMVVPQSLLDLLPLYHLIEIEWESGGEVAGQSQGSMDKVIPFIHVFFKTLYLQGFLWRTRSLDRRPCRRTIMALTSVARSVQFLERLGLPVSESARAFVPDILAFRQSWLNRPNSRDRQIMRLDALVQDALAIAITLPDSVASHLLGNGNGPGSGWRPRGVQYAPMNFVLEGPVDQPDPLISLVQGTLPASSMWTGSGKLKAFASGACAFVSPRSFAIVDLDFSISEGYRKTLGCHKWGPRPAAALREQAELQLDETLRGRFIANYQFAVALARAGLPGVNFGSVWMVPGYRGWVLRTMARTLGRFSPCRIAQSRWPHTVANGSASK